MLAAILARMMIISNMYYYMASAYKSINGQHAFCINNPEYYIEVFNYIRENNTVTDLCVMTYGSTIPVQEEINRRRYKINEYEYKALLKWHINNYSSYSDMAYP